MIDPAVERAAGRYLSQIDQLLPGAVVGFYLVGQWRSAPTAPVVVTSISSQSLLAESTSRIFVGFVYNTLAAACSQWRPPCESDGPR